MKNYYRQLLKRKPLVDYFSTGFKSLDRKILGYQKGELITIASRPDFGKTALALKSVIKNIKEGNKVLYFSLNETKIEIISKILCQMHNLPLKSFLLGEVANIQKSEIKNTLRIIDKYLIIEENLFSDIQSIIHIASFKHDAKMVLIDSFDYIKNDNLKNVNIIKELKNLAYENNYPILLLTSIDITLEKRINKIPMISDIKESNLISEFSDKILAIYSDDIYKERREATKEFISKASYEYLNYKSAYIDKPVIEKEIRVLKNKFGSLESITLDFFKTTAMFDEKKDLDLNNLDIEIPKII